VKKLTKTEGIVEEVIPNWYTKKNGGNVAAIKLKGIESLFVDWNNTLDIDVKKGDKLRILCKFWKPDNSAIPPNFCIQEVKKLEKQTELKPIESVDPKTEVIKLLKKAIKMIENPE
jgi:hypothetical protein